MAKPVINVAVTGGAGQIAYNLLFRIASGEVFGSDQPLALHILEVADALKTLEGVKMEIEDCAFPLLHRIEIGSEPKKIFKNAHYAILVGAKPRGPGMERAELLSENGKIFIEQGQALNAVAARNVKVLVVGNPCNTNALIAMTNAPNIPKENFFAMTMLDQNRAAFQLANKANTQIGAISKLAIWGNHSVTMVPDFYHAEINGKSAYEVINDSPWFETVFLPCVQKRGAAIIAARGKSSAASAANGVVDTMKALLEPTKKGDYFSVALCSNGNPYGVEENLIFSFPCRVEENGKVNIVPSIALNDFLRKKIAETEKELIEERGMALTTQGVK